MSDSPITLKADAPSVEQLEQLSATLTTLAENSQPSEPHSIAWTITVSIGSFFLGALLELGFAFPKYQTFHDMSTPAGAGDVCMALAFGLAAAGGVLGAKVPTFLARGRFKV